MKQDRDIIGVDGCPGGWLIVTLPGGSTGDARATLVASFAAVLAVAGERGVVAVDIPIGLPERAAAGGRACDGAARVNLGGRQSAVFSVPARAAVYAGDYAAACATALAHSDPPRRVSKQCFNLFPKIREIDMLMTPELQSRVYECHPEVGFWALNGERALDEPKKVRSQPHAPGLELRRGLLEQAGYAPAFLRHTPWPRRLVGPDDLLDAAVCAWTAARIARGVGRRFPPQPERDGKGLRMEIWG